MTPLSFLGSLIRTKNAVSTLSLKETLIVKKQSVVINSGCINSKNYLQQQIE